MRWGKVEKVSCARSLDLFLSLSVSVGHLAHSLAPLSGKDTFGEVRYQTSKVH